MAIEFPTGIGSTVYEYDLFTGTQTLVYIEDVWLDDCVRIGWSTNQSRTPIFGYASQYYNALADGVVLVNGSFWIGFKESALIPIILRRVSARRDPNDPFYASPALLPERGTTWGTDLATSSGLWQGRTDEQGNPLESNRSGGVAQRADIERLIRAEARDPDNEDVQRSLARYMVQMSAASDTEFEDLAESFEDTLWYGAAGPGDGRTAAMSGNFAGGEISDDQALAIRRADQFPPFDFVVTFGDMNNSAANHTIKRLIDVTITDTIFGPVDNSGEPIYVQYNFLARNEM